MTNKPNIPLGTPIPDDRWYQSGLPSGEYISQAVTRLMFSIWDSSVQNWEPEMEQCYSNIGDVLEGLQDAVTTGRSQKTFPELIDICTSLVMASIHKSYVASGKERPLGETIERLAVHMVNGALKKINSDMRLAFTPQGSVSYNVTI